MGRILSILEGFSFLYGGDWILDEIEAKKPRVGILLASK
jgi:hypothetical protein